MVTYLVYKYLVKGDKMQEAMFESIGIGYTMVIDIMIIFSIAILILREL